MSGMIGDAVEPLPSGQLHASEGQQRFLLALSDNLRLLRDPSDIIATTTRALGEFLAATRVIYADIDGAGASAATEGEWTDGTVARLPSHVNLSDFGGRLIATLETGRPLVVENVIDHPATGESLSALASIGVAALISVPLVKGGRFAANLNVHSRVPRVWTVADVDLVKAVAERTWDVLARARAVSALADREQELQILTDAMPVLISYVDRDERYQFNNRAYSEWFGLDQGELTGKQVRDVIGDAAYALLKPQIDRALKGERFSFEQLVPYKHGQLRHVHVDFVPRKDRDNDVKGYYAVTQDVSERIQTDIALRASETRLRFLDSLGAATGVLADAHAILETATRMLGEHLCVSICAYADMDDDEDGFTIRGDWAAPGSKSIVGRYRLADFGRLAVANLGSGRPLVINDNLRELAPKEAAKFQGIGIAATICMPLVKGGRLTALMAVHDCVPRIWSDEDLGLMREVTERSWAHIERVRAVADLRNSEAELRRLNADLERQVIERTMSRGKNWQVSPDLMGALNRSGYFETFNPAWTTVLGWSEREVARMSIWEMLHPEDIERTRAGFALTQDGQPAIRFPNRYRCKDGSYRWISWVGVPEDGLVYCTGRDITAERAREVELAARTAERDQLWELSPDLLAVIDYDGQLLRVNPSWNRVLGYSDEYLLNRPYVEILHPDEVASTMALVAEIGATERAALLEHRLQAVDGSWRTFVWSLSPEPGGQRLYCVGRDVTEDRAQAKALAARTAERDQLWTLSADMLARADLNGMMSAVSPAWTRLLGFSENELVTRPYANFMHPDDTQVTLAALRRMGETRAPVKFENRILTRAGTYIPVEWTVAPEPDGVNFIAVGRDLTEAKARERDLEQAQSALRQSLKLEAMGQLTGGVAHDFNNLLTAVMSNLELLGKRHAGDEKAVRLVEGAMQGAQRGATLTQRMLAFARRQELKVEPHSLPALVESALGLLRQSVGDAVELKLDLAQSVPLALVDENQFDLALLNLVLNARDAMPDGGVITVRVDHRVATGDAGAPGKDYVCLTVADDGHGMDEVTLERATQPFFSTKGVGKGSGLGLSMIHGLALQLNGHLHLESELGIGTTAELWIPATNDPRQPASPAAEPATDDEQPRPLRVLLVDDDVLISMSTVDMLEDLGHVVTSAYSGRQALEILQMDPSFDLLITDFSMPKMNGGQLAVAVRNLYPKLPILLATGYAELPSDSDLKLPRLAKPYLQHQMQAEIERLVKG